MNFWGEDNGKFSGWIWGERIMANLANGFGGKGSVRILRMGLMGKDYGKFGVWIWGERIMANFANGFGGKGSVCGGRI